MILTRNRKVDFEYFVEDTLVVGIVLEGWEVKSILGKRASISESFVTFNHGELFLRNARFEPTNSFKMDHPDPTRHRKLLASKRQINHFAGKVTRDGYTLVIKDLHYSDTRKIKATLCLCKGKKKHDKRETIKARDIERDNARSEYC